jgi:hypothetical protein
MLKIIDGPNCDLKILNNFKLKKFIIKRVFFLVAKKKCTRGNHAHKKCSQIFFSLNGSFKIKIFNGNKTIVKAISPKTKGILIKPYHWVELILDKQNICMIVCDRKYEKNDYITDKSKINIS